MQGRHVDHHTTRVTRHELAASCLRRKHAPQVSRPPTLIHVREGKFRANDLVIFGVVRRKAAGTRRCDDATKQSMRYHLGHVLAIGHARGFSFCFCHPAGTTNPRKSVWFVYRATRQWCMRIHDSENALGAGGGSLAKSTDREEAILAPGSFRNSRWRRLVICCSVTWYKCRCVQHGLEISCPVIRNRHTGNTAGLKPPPANKLQSGHTLQFQGLTSTASPAFRARACANQPPILL